MVVFAIDNAGGSVKQLYEKGRVRGHLRERKYMCVRKTIELEQSDDVEVFGSGRKAVLSTAVKRVVVVGPVGFEIVQYTVSQNRAFIHLPPRLRMSIQPRSWIGKTVVFARTVRVRKFSYG